MYTQVIEYEKNGLEEKAYVEIKDKHVKIYHNKPKGNYMIKIDDYTYEIERIEDLLLLPIVYEKYSLEK